MIILYICEYFSNFVYESAIGCVLPCTGLPV